MKKATKTIPLAPPAPLGPTLPSTKGSNIQQGASKTKFQWTAWLSPRTARPKPSDRAHSDDESPRTGRRKVRRLTFDRAASAAATGPRLNRERGGAGYFASQSLSFGKGQSPPHVGGSSLLASRSADEAFDAPPGAGGMERQGHPRTSLLTAFLFHLNSLLPKYCEHLSNACDTPHSTTNAAKAVGVLEEGAKTLSITFRMHNTSPHSSAGSHAEGAMASSAPTSPLHPTISPTKKHGTSPVSDGSPSKLADVRHWIYPLSPRGASHPTPAANQWSPTRKKATSGSAPRWNAAVVESEWERFVHPFLMLAGAECLYARMEHVLDPARGVGEEGTSGESKGGAGENVVKFAVGEKQEDRAGPVLPVGDAHRRGSRRLIAMYRQIREDCIIVGEYLCDPVIGTRSDGQPGTSGSPGQRFPPPPLKLDASSRQSSPRTKGAESALDESEGSRGVPRRAAHEQRERAATSLRGALDALVSFIDARCVLIRVHADLCCPSPSPLPSIEARSGTSDSRGRKWMAWAEQCRSSRDPVAAWAKEQGCVTRRVASNVEKELKALELALTSAHQLFECDLFQCTLNVRRLHVLLLKLPFGQSSLPLLYIRSSLVELLAMMHVYFADAGAMLEMIRTSASDWRRNNESPKKPGTALAKSKMQDYNALFTEFVARNANGVPLAAAVVRRVGGQRNSLSGEHLGEVEKDENLPDTPLEWEPLYLKRNSEDTSDSIFKRGSQSPGPNFVRMIRENFSADPETDDKQGGTNAKSPAKKHERGTTWPFQEWAGIETVLSKVSETGTINPSKHPIESTVSRELVRKNSGNIRRRGPALNQPRVLSQCYVSFISDSLYLVVIQGVGQPKQHRATDDDIHMFMRMMVPKLGPENLLSVRAVTQLKSELKGTEEKRGAHPNASSLADNNNVPTSSLWSESGWSDDQRKKILHSLGLRRKHSPVMAPLKSPYVKRKLGRQRKKKMKSSINHGHLDFFLGPELSHLL